MNDVNNDQQLRAEIEGLKRELARARMAAQEAQPKKPGARSAMVVILLLLCLLLAGYYLGYVPRQRRELALAAESKTDAAALPVVAVSPVKRSADNATLVLPGNIQAVTEAPVLARASGYIKTRFADIGDRVKASQVLAEIEAPELDQQIRQASAAIEQADSNIEQTQAALQQGQANEGLAKSIADRQQRLFDKNVVSRQENETAQAQYSAQQANVQALTKSISAARSAASAVRANLARLQDLKSYQTVRAPFAGVITVRNIDVGALVNEGSTLLFRIAQSDRLRIYLNVPQLDAGNVRVGLHATLTVPDLGGRKFTGIVTRTSNALDPASRTLLAEVQVENAGGVLMPGMYSLVDLAVPRKNPPLVIPGDTVVVRADGPQVAVVGSDGVVHFKLIKVGRDFGDRVEVLEGVEEGQQLAVNPGDTVREGVQVKATAVPEKATKK